MYIRNDVICFLQCLKPVVNPYKLYFLRFFSLNPLCKTYSKFKSKSLLNIQNTSIEEPEYMNLWHLFLILTSLKGLWLWERSHLNIRWRITRSYSLNIRNWNRKDCCTSCVGIPSILMEKVKRTKLLPTLLNRRS